ncbi:hypothetical protein QO207_07320 [Pseudomonas sp. CAN2814]|uniref:hypothetical protein n=1 Tax=Pseudomonas sp. CAN1 TaxID=3046726 RepID=UPI0026476505|nr:hypothetical protein [Pseudomonas sp. CAN1]MDN6856393.1 hypothetical protein [Pseudomonas sp. CAN1]
MPLKLRFNEGIFRLSEKPDVRGKTFAFFGAFAKEGRPRGRNTEFARTPKRRWNAYIKAAKQRLQSAVHTNEKGAP